MKIFKRTGIAGNAEGAAVTVDWVVLAAAIVGLTIAMLTSLHSSDDRVPRAVVDAPDEAATSSSTFP